MKAKFYVEDLTPELLKSARELNIVVTGVRLETEDDGFPTFRLEVDIEGREFEIRLFLEIVTKSK